MLIAINSKTEPVTDHNYQLQSIHIFVVSFARLHSLYMLSARLICSCWWISGRSPARFQTTNTEQEKHTGQISQTIEIPPTADLSTAVANLEANSGRMRRLAYCVLNLCLILPRANQSNIKEIINSSRIFAAKIRVKRL